jgi:UDP-N-acetylmuramate dehydrogenase
MNTFGIDVNLSTVISLEHRDDLLALAPYLQEKEISILGGGSNVLLTQDIRQPVLLVNTQGKQVVLERETYDLIKVEAGENWHNLVLWAVEQGYGGIENLALIPGKCGAGPMQNIGAYGVEIKDVLHSVSAYNLKEGKIYTFHNTECGFGYRTSHFKTKWKDQFIILDIILRLAKPGHHLTNLSYGAIAQTLNERGVKDAGIKEVAETVIAIRQAKLPNPSEVGNAGSFFKNPVVDKSILKTIQKAQPEAPHYPVDDSRVKLPAGWLIDQCGWKGKQVGQTGTYKNQALVLVNHGSASGSEVYALSEEIQQSVHRRYNILLEREVNVW